MKQFQINFWYDCQRIWLHKLKIREFQKKKIKAWKNYNKVTDIDINDLIKENIKTLILDMDGTVKHYKSGVSQENIDWVNQAKKFLNIYLVSNSNKELTSEIANILNIKYINSARKPSKKGFERIIKIVQTDLDQICVIGDSLLADINGAQKNGIRKTILVEDLNKEKI